MGKLKIVELVVLAATALLAAVKAVIKFLDYMGRLRAERTECAA